MNKFEIKAKSFIEFFCKNIQAFLGASSFLLTDLRYFIRTDIDFKALILHSY